MTGARPAAPADAAIAQTPDIDWVAKARDEIDHAVQDSIKCIEYLGAGAAIVGTMPKDVVHGQGTRQPLPLPADAQMRPARRHRPVRKPGLPARGPADAPRAAGTSRGTISWC